MRRTEEYNQGHIESAVSIPLASVLDAESTEKVITIMQDAGIGDHTPVAVYDDTFGALAQELHGHFNMQAMLILHSLN